MADELPDCLGSLLEHGLQRVCSSPMWGLINTLHDRCAAHFNRRSAFRRACTEVGSWE